MSQPSLVGRGRHLREPLRVGDDLGRVQRVLEVLGERLRAGAGRGRPGEPLGGGYALLLQRAQRPGEHRLGDPGQRDAELERVLGGPAAGALLLGGVEDHVDQRLARSRRRSWRARAR